MKACIPIESPNEKKSIIRASFEWAEYYLLYDTKSNSYEIINKNQRDTEKNESGNPLTSILPGGADAIITIGLRSPAFVLLKRCGIKMFKAQSDLAFENLNLFNQDLLQELTITDLSQGSPCGSPCSSCAKRCK